MEVPIASVSRTKKCSYCAEEILAEAKKCHHCGEFLDSRLSRGTLLKALAAVGSFLLVVAPFAQLFSDLHLTLLQYGRVEALILLAVALVALGLSLMERYTFLWFSGALGIKAIGDMLYVYFEKLPVALGISESARVDPDWGALVLVVGTLTTLGVPISNWITRRTLTRVGKIGATVVVLVAIYQTVMVCFPYLHPWPYMLWSLVNG